MNKLSLDFDQLSSVVNKKTIFKYEDVKHRLVKVAYDIVRFQDSNDDELWQIQNADDGSYIVAKYSDAETDTESTKKVANWSVVLSKTAGQLNVFYKNCPITSIAGSSLGIDKNDLESVSRFLPKRLAEDKNLAQALLNYLTPSEKEAVLKLYPEIAQ